MWTWKRARPSTAPADVERVAPAPAGPEEQKEKFDDCTWGKSATRAKSGATVRYCYKKGVLIDLQCGGGTMMNKGGGV